MNKDIHILLVEDDEIDARAVKRAFAKNRIGNDITVACDGVDALDRIHGRNGHQAVPRPFIVLLDMNMPRMNGLEFLTAVRADPQISRTIIFLLTTSNDQRDKLAAYEQNVAGYILKGNAGAGFIRLVQMLDHFLITVQLPPEEAETQAVPLLK